MLSCLLGMAVPTSEGTETPVGGASGGSPEGSVDELVTVQKSVHLGPFQTEIIEEWVKPLLGYTSHVMITLLRVEGQPQETKPFPLGLHILHAYTHLKTAAEGCLWWSEMCLTATSSSTRVCRWHGLCLHHWCHLQSCHQR